MVTVRNAFGWTIGALIFAAFALCLDLGSAATAADAALKNPSKHEFKDPYNGGTRLPKGGGEPGKAYMELLVAAGKIDSQRICRLMSTGENELKECLKNKKAAEGIAFWLGDPKGQKILDGFSKGNEATLDVAYPHAGGPDSYASVRMKKAGGKWIWNGFSASGSGEISASASGTADLGAPTKPGKQPSSPQDCPMLGKWNFIGKDDKGGAWKGGIDIRIENEEVTCEVSIQGPEFSSGVGGPFECSPDQKNFTCAASGNSFTAVLSANGEDLTNGRWTTKGDDFLDFPKVTGTWSANSLGR
ncbi:MAG: hypothetical protein EG824_09100 [Deltaproteobacteria bacterium]|nr:hypothetical protein [Deltaproteobacteria bacterium]